MNKHTKSTAALRTNHGLFHVLTSLVPVVWPLSRYRGLIFWAGTVSYLCLHGWLVSSRAGAGQSSYLEGLLSLLSFMFLLGLVSLFPDRWTLKHQHMFIGGISSVVFLTTLLIQVVAFPLATQDILLYFGGYGVLALFHLTTIWLLIKLVSEYQLPLKRVLLYTLNPWVLHWISGEGGLLTLPILLLCSGFLLFKKASFLWGWLAFGGVILIHPLAALLVPFWLTSKNWKASLLPVGASLFFWLFWGETAGGKMLSSFFPTGSQQLIGDFMFFKILSENVLTISSLALLGICLLVIFLGVHDPLRSTFLVAGCGAFLGLCWLPWYLALLTIFLVFYPSRAWFYVQMAVGSMFLMEMTLPHNSLETLPVFLLIYLPFLGILVWDLLHHQHIFQSHVFTPVQTMSVIMPALNEADNLAHCLRVFQQNSRVKETIVVDGGSTDATETIARRTGTRFLQSPKGRGRQIKAGIAQAAGDVLVILHADCLIAPDLPDRIIEFLNEHPDHIGGAVGMSYVNHTPANRVIAWLNNWRARWAGIAFGDQVQFFRKEALPLIGGYPEMMLMEDIELSMRLKEHGSVGFLPHGVTVSKRRWQKRGILNNVKKVLWLSGSYLVQRRLKVGDPARLDFYERYYHA